MIINYDIAKINKVLKDFYNACGINMDLLKEDFSFAGNESFRDKIKYCKAIQSTKEGRYACICSDKCILKRSTDTKKTEMHVCHAGLVDVSVPILYNDIIIGYLIFGQIRTDTKFSDIENYLEHLGLDIIEMKKYFEELSVYSLEEIQSISNIAWMLVKHILLENMLMPDSGGIQKALVYINENLESALSIQSISKNVNISKSVLYRWFRSLFNCTVGEYINKKRIDKAVELLDEDSLSIEQIAQKTGFSSGSYFSKMFKKEKGLSPLKFKNSRKVELA